MDSTPLKKKKIVYIKRDSLKKENLEKPVNRRSIKTKPIFIKFLNSKSNTSIVVDEKENLDLYEKDTIKVKNTDKQQLNDSMDTKSKIAKVNAIIKSEVWSDIFYYEKAYLRFIKQDILRSVKKFNNKKVLRIQRAFKNYKLRKIKHNLDRIDQTIHNQLEKEKIEKEMEITEDISIIPNQYTKQRRMLNKLFDSNGKRNVNISVNEASELLLFDKFRFPEEIKEKIDKMDDIHRNHNSLMGKQEEESELQPVRRPTEIPKLTENERLSFVEMSVTNNPIILTPLVYNAKRNVQFLFSLEILHQKTRKTCFICTSSNKCKEAKAA